MKQSNDSLIIEKEALHLKAKNAERESSSLKEQLNSALQSLDEMMKYIDASREEHDDVIQCLERDLNKALELKQAAESKVRRLADKLKKGEAIMKEKLDKQMGTSLDKIAELETSIKEKMAETTLLHDKVKMLQGKVDQFNQISKTKESEMTRQREEHQVKLAEETSVRIKLEKDKQSLVEKLSTLEQENTELKESLAEARGRECHDVEHKEQSCKIKELDALVQEKTVEAISLQDKIKTIEAGIEELNQSRKKEVEEREVRLSAVEEENAELKDSLEKCKCKESQLAELKEVLQQTKKTEIQLRGELAHKRQQVAISESNARHLQEHITSLEAQIDKLINDYESKLEDMSES
jgi:chromosome segregation ATPase